MPYEIRRYDAPELRPYLLASEIPFGNTATERSVTEHERYLERDRLVAAYDGGTPVGTGAVLSLRLTVPGGEIAAGGVTEISVLPTHRRRGILRGMMAWLLDDIRTHGEPVAILWASEAAIYPRFGYGIASLGATLEIPTAAGAFREPPPVEGTLRLVEGAEASPALHDVYERARGARAGFVTRPEAMWDHLLRDVESEREGAGATLTALHEVDGRVEGYVRYRMRPAWLPAGHDNTVEVRELIATTSRSERALWRLLLDLDLTARVRASDQPVDSPLLLLLAEPRRMRFMLGDALLLRLVDLPAALAARTYAEPGTVVLDVVDPGAPWNTGRWRLTAGAGSGDACDGCAATAERTEEPADLALSVTDLGSAYLGGFSFAALERAGRVAELAPGGAARADAMFAISRAPWCPHEF